MDIDIALKRRVMVTCKEMCTSCNDQRQQFVNALDIKDLPGTHTQPFVSLGGLIEPDITSL